MHPDGAVINATRNYSRGRDGIENRPWLSPAEKWRKPENGACHAENDISRPRNAPPQIVIECPVIRQNHELARGVRHHFRSCFRQAAGTRGAGALHTMNLQQKLNRKI